MFSVIKGPVFSFWLSLEIAGAGPYIGTRLKLFNTCTDEIQCHIARAFIGSSGAEFSLSGNEPFSSWCCSSEVEPSVSLLARGGGSSGG